MEGPIRQAEAVPVPLALRRRAVALIAVTVATVFAGAGATARRADAAANPLTSQIPAVASMILPPPTVVARAVAAQDDEEGDDGPDVTGVYIPAHLLARLRIARATGDLALFEDVAHEIALLLVR